MKRQIYIDPTYYITGKMGLRIIWDKDTWMKVKIEFPPGTKRGSADRMTQIQFMLEIIRRSGYEFQLTRDEFINMQFGEFKNFKIKVEEVKI